VEEENNSLDEIKVNNDEERRTYSEDKAVMEETITNGEL